MKKENKELDKFINKLEIIMDRAECGGMYIGDMFKQVYSLIKEVKEKRGGINKK